MERRDAANLFECSVSELENVDDSDESTIVLDDGKVEVVSD